MKFKNIMKVAALPALLLASAVAFATARPQKASEVRADTEVGNVALDFDTNVHNGSSVIHGNQYNGDNLAGVYLTAPANSAASSWDFKLHPVGGNGGLLIDGVDQGNAELIKYSNSGYYLILSLTPAQAGAVVTVQGDWTGSFEDVTYNMTLSPSLSLLWDGLSLEYVHEKFSLMDCGIADYSGVAFNTESAYGTPGLYNNGFGLPNPDDSFALQFYFEASSKVDETMAIRIGGNGSWGNGHIMYFWLNTSWGPAGQIGVRETIDDATYNSHAIECQADITTSGPYLLELGVVKLPNSSNYSVYFKVDGKQFLRASWELEGTVARTTRVAFSYGQTNVSISNSIDANKVGTSKLNYINTAGNAMYLYHENDVEPNSPWEVMAPLGENNVTLNGTSIIAGHANNYFKKTGIRDYYFGLGTELGISTLNAGDLLKIGGTFKLVHEVSTGVYSVYKIALANSYFEYNGTDWVAVDPDYEAADFAKDLLKLTLPVCSAADEGNHDALAAIWAQLAGVNYYGKLIASEVDTLIAATADKTIEVPNTAAGIDAMNVEDALQAAMYRYDFCTAKYNLSAFIVGRVSSLATSGRVALPNNTHNNTLVIVIVVTAASSLCLAGLILFRKRKAR